MLVQAAPPLHLTYCLNIHAGETWAENFAAIRTHAMEVADAFPDRRPFGLGLRLSARAAAELSADQSLAVLRTFLGDNGLYAFTINGFPYGQFHDAVVKQNVYAPDWQTPQRRDYTNMLADILAALLPEGVAGSISTVPGSYKAWVAGGGATAAVFAPDAAKVQAMAGMLADVAAHLAEIRDRTGKDICLALEPEPDCYIETTDESIAFLTGPLLEHGGRHLAACGVAAGRAEEILRRHVGLCVDTAHAAVEFEDPAADLRKLQAAGIRVAKIQLSAALGVCPTQEGLRQLEPFVDRVYLHQVKAAGGGCGCESFPDLPEALARAATASGLGAMRVHFHVPLFWQPAGGLQSTACLLGEEFWRVVREGACSHLEIETYTFGVLPEGLRQLPVAQSIVREFQWVLGRLA